MGMTQDQIADYVDEFVTNAEVPDVVLDAFQDAIDRHRPQPERRWRGRLVFARSEALAESLGLSEGEHIIDVDLPNGPYIDFTYDACTVQDAQPAVASIDGEGVWTASGQPWSDLTIHIKEIR